MAIDDNVVKMPDLLERLATRLTASLTKDTKIRAEWVELKLEQAETITAAKAQFPNTQKFGDWLRDNDLGDNVIPPDTRMALIAFGSNLPRARLVLEKSDRWSVEQIYRNEWAERVRDVPKSPPLGGPKLQEAKDKILAYEAATGKLPPADRHFKMPGVTESTYDRAIREVRSVRAQAEALGPLKFTKAQDGHVEARLRILSRQLEAEFSERVRLGVLERNAGYLAGLEELEKKARLNEEFYRRMIERNEKGGIFTEAEFENIRFCLHPDNSASPEKRSSAFVTFNLKKLQLTGKK